MSRQQDLMGQAIEHITAHAADHEDRRKIYGGLYHKLPVLIRTCGLCQALAFVNSKTQADDDRGSAHQAVMSDVTQVLTRYCGVTLQQGDKGGILSAVRRLNSRQYALATRILLQSLVFHKRFAESILGVEATDYTAEENAAKEKEV
ncbi:MAG: type III-B CRISPR module-associated protein Cmr5 [Armatimonadota bacterium]